MGKFTTFLVIFSMALTQCKPFHLLDSSSTTESHEPITIGSNLGEKESKDVPKMDLSTKMEPPKMGDSSDYGKYTKDDSNNKFPGASILPTEDNNSSSTFPGASIMPNDGSKDDSKFPGASILPKDDSNSSSTFPGASILPVTEKNESMMIHPVDENNEMKVVGVSN